MVALLKIDHKDNFVAIFISFMQKLTKARTALLVINLNKYFNLLKFVKIQKNLISSQEK